jgi:hypothetical protein
MILRLTSTDGTQYDLHINAEWNPPIPYISFLRKGESIPGRIPVHKFIDIVCNLGYFCSDAWLAAIELGPEIWWGDGRATIRDMNLRLS